MKEMLKVAKSKKNGFPEDAVCELEKIAKAEMDDREKERQFVEKMDETLDEGQRLLLWQSGGSCTGGETGRQVKAIAPKISDKTLAEKIKAMNENPHIYKTELNGDGTITAYCGCHCLQYRITKPKTAKAPSAYGCAAGAAFQNLKIALGVDVRIKSIDYPKEGDGNPHMTFVLEVVA